MFEVALCSDRMDYGNHEYIIDRESPMMPVVMDNRWQLH